ncbi:hypothetical protein ACIRQQ_30020 [Streptomyces fuscichromogenes]|uniref:hypothetical protein n=1 Tax=Streptomyces fuscichromogenes TaxID=1324013 RepID=UPI0037FB84E0
MDSEPRFDDVPSPLRPLLTALLRSDPDTRFTADEVIEELTRLGGDGHPPESSPRPDQAHTPQVRATAAGPAGGDTEVVSGQPVAPREVTRTASSGRLDAAPPASPTPTAPAALPAPPPDPATPQPRAAARPRAATYPAVP